MATHCSVPAWRIPGTGEPGGLPSMGSATQQPQHSYDICYFYVQLFIIIYMFSFCPVTSKYTSECKCLKDKDFIYFYFRYFFLGGTSHMVYPLIL